MIVLGTQIGVKSVAICPKTNDIIVCSLLDEAENKTYDFDVVSVLEEQYYTEFSFDQSIEFVEEKIKGCLSC
jgi:hypothetical protein